MVIVNPILIYCMKILFEDQSSKNLNKISNLLKLSMVFGLIAILSWCIKQKLINEEIR